MSAPMLTTEPDPDEKVVVELTRHQLERLGWAFDDAVVAPAMGDEPNDADPADFLDEDDLSILSAIEQAQPADHTADPWVVDEVLRQLDQVYRERSRFIAYLAAVYPSAIGLTDPADFERYVVTVDTPSGQLTWHVEPRDLDLFGHVDRTGATLRERWAWDGHPTDVKYRRLQDLVGRVAAQHLRTVTKEQAEEIVELLESLLTYVPDYFSDKWSFAAEVAKARAALLGTTTTHTEEPTP